MYCLLAFPPNPFDQSPLPQYNIHNTPDRDACRHGGRAAPRAPGGATGAGLQVGEGHCFVCGGGLHAGLCVVSRSRLGWSGDAVVVSNDPQYTHAHAQHNRPPHSTPHTPSSSNPKTRPGYNLPTMTLNELAAQEVAEAQAREARARCVHVHTYVRRNGEGENGGGSCHLFHQPPINPIPPGPIPLTGTRRRAPGGPRSSRRTGRRTTPNWGRRPPITTGRGTIGRTITREGWGTRRGSGFELLYRAGLGFGRVVGGGWAALGISIRRSIKESIHQRSGRASVCGGRPRCVWVLRG